jgi:hypothetical protein
MVPISGIAPAMLLIPNAGMNEPLMAILPPGMLTGAVPSRADHRAAQSCIIDGE